MIDNDNFRCDHCKELIPDVMLWIEVTGTYKFRKSYNTFRWDFCDLFCLRDYLKSNNIDWDGIEEAKHKIKKGKKK